MVPDMRGKTIQAGIFAGLAALCLVWGAGCGRASGEQREARDRHLRQAYAAMKAKDIDRAIGLCEQALARHPDLALAHRELGLMLDNFRQDYVPALYHYQRYLQLRPDAKDREGVEELIQHCRFSFAAQLAEAPEELKKDLQARDARIRKLEMELVGLREKVAGLGLGAAPGSPVKSAAKENVRQAGASVASAGLPPGQVHVVQAGENLATISTRYYGTPARWKNIFNANQDRLTDANNLRVGTQLTIPKE
jgi:tetratricopeptide (TPR) repeat protein